MNEREENANRLTAAYEQKEGELYQGVTLNLQQYEEFKAGGDAVLLEYVKKQRGWREAMFSSVEMIKDINNNVTSVRVLFRKVVTPKKNEGDDE